VRAWRRVIRLHSSGLLPVTIRSVKIRKTRMYSSRAALSAMSARVRFPSDGGGCRASKSLLAAREPATAFSCFILASTSRKRHNSSRRWRSRNDVQSPGIQHHGVLILNPSAIECNSPSEGRFIAASKRSIPNFSGVWTLDLAKSNLGRAGEVRQATAMEVAHDGNRLTVVQLVRAADDKSLIQRNDQ